MLLTKERTLHWKSGELRFTPTIQNLAALAVELRTMSAGTANTLALAQQMLNGTADPVFVSVALRHFLKWAGVELTVDEAYIETISGAPDIILFRITYIETVVPNVDLGKKPEGQSPAPTKQNGHTKSPKNTTSRRSSQPG